MTRVVDRIAARLGAARSVVVVVDEPRELAELAAPGRDVRAVVHPGDVDALHDLLSGWDHADAVVDLARGPGAAHRLPMLATHVAAGGLLLVALPRPEAARRRVDDLLADAAGLRSSGLTPPARFTDERPVSERDRHAFAASVDDVEVADGFVVLRCVVETWSLVPETRFDDLLEAHPGLGEVVAHRGPQTRHSEGSVRSSWDDEVAVAPLEAPGMSLRAYDDAVVTPRLVAHARDVVLPQAFRNTSRRRPRTPALAEWTRWAVRVPAELSAEGPPPEPLPGTWFHADNILRGHFGHAVTEQVSQLWAWPEVVARHPDAGVLVTDADRPVAAWELDLLEAAGVPRERVRAVSGPVRVERLLAATPGYVILSHVHPSLRPFYAGVGDALERLSGLETTPRRLFVTRRHGKRHCHEAAELEALFVRHGFTLVAPEEHPLPDQVAMARHAEAVAGYGGSGMFHLLLGGRPRPVVVVSHTGYHVWNEKAIAALWDHPLTIVRGTPDFESDHFSRQAMHSDYHLDLDREGRLVHDVLEGL